MSLNDDLRFELAFRSRPKPSGPIITMDAEQKRDADGKFGSGGGSSGGTEHKKGTKLYHLAEAKHAHETGEKAVAKGMHDVATEWMQKAAEHRKLAREAKE